MSRWIDADALKANINTAFWSEIEKIIDSAPSLDLVTCAECKWAKANGTYQWCGRLDSTARITDDDFCSCGERKDNE